MGKSLNIYPRILLSLLLTSFVQFGQASFIYKDFNITDGLQFIGAAGTTNCFNNTLNNYGDVQGNADLFDSSSAIERGESTALISESTVQTNDARDNEVTEKTLAGFLNRNDTVQAPSKCNVRARLTPSNPSKTGAMWFRDPVQVSNGFDTMFTFQISDHSKQCTLYKDQYLSMTNYRSCSVHGADGFAFVIHFHPNTTKTIGKVGGQMGFGGIENSLAIAFDTWTNPGEDKVFGDHVSVQSRSSEANDALEAGLLGVPKVHKLADGKIHLARVSYYGELKSEYFNKLVASDSLLPYLKDNGEQKRVGTLVVFLDEGVEKNEPLLALPINLSLLLRMPTDQAYVGFTSSTGRFYEKHDILSWVWCDAEPCDFPTVEDFDYHQESAFSAVPKRYEPPGEGYGGGDTSGFPTKNKSPDTDPWFTPVSYYAKGYHEGLADTAQNQVPPNTLY